MRLALIGALILCRFCVVWGQETAPARSFEAASIRVRLGAPQWKLDTSGDRLTIESYTLFGLIMEAYNLQNYEFERAGAGPLVLSSDTLYDITAKAEDGSAPKRDEFREMLRALLVDRFHLKVHREMKEMPVYALTAGRNGTKLKASATDASSPVLTSGHNPVQIRAAKITMVDLARQLSGYTDRPVLNKTGIEGTYEVNLSFVPENRMGHGADSDMTEVSLFTAVQQQLGLKLEAQQAPVEVLAVDHVEKPSEN
jgi:uncharacterized protein (TIGR03435 family)